MSLLSPDTSKAALPPSIIPGSLPPPIAPVDDDSSFETEEEPKQQTLLSGNGGWGGTSLVSKSGHAVHSKTTTNGRTIYSIMGKDGKLRRASRYEIETGRKPPKCSKPKGGIKKSKAKAKGKGKSQYMQAKGKFMKESKRGKAIDKSKQARKVVYSAKKYKPNKNDFAGLDTKKK